MSGYSIEFISVLHKPSIVVGFDLVRTFLSKDIRVAAPTSSKFVIITDRVVSKKHLPNLLEALKDAEIEKERDNLFIYELLDGEHTKSREQKSMIEDFMFENSCNRDTCIIALGGGVIGDLSGFVAATYMRGIPFVQIPTTLLAMIDSSIGGKTGINTNHAKNLLGSFHQPVRIYMDLIHLLTLPKRQISNGMAEVIKTFAIADEENFHFLEENYDQVFDFVPSVLHRIVAACSQIKAKFVTEDETEQGVRSLLNFGHTIGHAIESICVDFMLHGECVAIGMIKEAEVARFLGHLSPSSVQRLSSLIKLYGLPLTIPENASVTKLMEKMKLDKKNARGRKRCVLLNKIGGVLEPRASFVEDSLLERVLSPNVEIVPKFNIQGKIRVPGSKSISNRALLLAALGVGECRITGLLHSDDTQVCLKALKQLGAATFEFEKGKDNEEILVVKSGAQHYYEDEQTSEQRVRSHLKAPKEPIYLGNAGTATRFLATLCTLVNADHNEENVVLTGDKRMCERPIKDLVDALRDYQGCHISYLGNPGCPPLAISSTGLKGGEISLAANISSQFVSSILISGPYANTPITLKLDPSKEVVSQPYIDMTTDLMRDFGIDVKVWENNRVYSIPKGVYKNPAQYAVECDASSSTYPLSIAAITGGAVTALQVGKNSVQGDSQYCYVLEKMGCTVTQTAQHTTVEGPKNGLLVGVTVDMNHLTDAFMGVAVLGAVAKGTTKITGIGNQRVKECNRIAVMVEQLSKLGVKCSELEDGIQIEGLGLGWEDENKTENENNNNLRDSGLINLSSSQGSLSDSSFIAFEEEKKVYIQCYNDHRIAMSFAVLGCRISGIVVMDKECTQKTYPEFWDDFVNVLGGELKVPQVQKIDTSHKKEDKKPKEANVVNSKRTKKVIVVIGMRGAGKTTQSKVAAFNLGYDLVDVDEFIEKHLRGDDATDNFTDLEHIKQFISKEGFEKFREKETHILQKIINEYSIALSPEYIGKGVVISCGGGIVESQGSRDLLQNLILQGVPIVHLQRNIDDVANYLLFQDSTRSPFSEHPSDVFRRRLPHYISCSTHDFFVERGLGVDQSKSWTATERNFTSFVKSVVSSASFELPQQGSLFLSLTYPDYEQLTYEVLQEISVGIHALEFRVDLLSNLALENISYQISILKRLNTFELPIIFTLRTKPQGGSFSVDNYSEEESEKNILDVVKIGVRAGCEVIDVESCWSQKIRTEILKMKSKYGFGVISSFHCYDEKIWESDEKILHLYRKCSYDNVDVVKVVLKAISVSDSVRLNHISAYKAKHIFAGPTISICTSEYGRLSRVLNSVWTPVTHPSLPIKAAPGQISAREINTLRSELGLITPQNFYLFGKPISKSRSPLIHNTGFQELGLPHTYRLCETDQVEVIKEHIQSDFTGGGSVTIPNKVTVITLIGNLSDHAKKIGAINTIIKKNGELFGDNTDWYAIKILIEQKLTKKNVGSNFGRKLQALVIGAGGTSRAVCYALKKLEEFFLVGIDVWIVNRTLEKAEKVAAEMNVNAHSGGFHKALPISPDILVNTIPLDAQTELLSDIQNWMLVSNPIVVELVYYPMRTPFIEIAKNQREKNGISNHQDFEVLGIDILLEQGFKQFSLWTNTKVPPRAKIIDAVYKSILQ